MIDAGTELYCIFGSPVRHSLSPVIHNAAFACAGVNAAYLAFEPSDPAAAVSAVTALPIRGASVTIPFKTGIIPFLDAIDPLAEKIGAVNTIANRDGILYGYNTDGEGACTALENSIGDLAGQSVLLLGTGGSARAISFALLDRGSHVTIAGRMGRSQNDLVENLSSYFRNIRSVLITDLHEDMISRHSVIINTTPLGMKASDPLPIDTTLLSPHQTVFDIVYRPHMTPLLERASEKGCTVVFGIEMLIRQAAAQFRIWTGKEAPVAAMRAAADAVLANEGSRA